MDEESERRSDIDEIFNTKQQYQRQYKLQQKGGQRSNNYNLSLSSLVDFSSQPNLKRAWSDESTVVSMAAKYERRRNMMTNNSNSDGGTNLTLPSYDESTVISNQCTTNGTDNLSMNTFEDWVNFTTNFTKMVSKQINDCTAGDDDAIREPESAFTLKDEDFFWNPTIQSYDTLDTRKTNELTTSNTSSFAKWGQNVQLWQEDEADMSKLSHRSSRISHSHDV
jgi:hypothetical protein